MSKKNLLLCTAFFVMSMYTVHAVGSKYVNVAPQAETLAAHYTAGWNSLSAINDGTTGTGNTLANNLTWASWSDNRPSEGWLTYEWSDSVTLSRCTVYFWTDTDNDDAGNGVAMPKSWKIQWADADGNWQDVALTDSDNYPHNRLAANLVNFTEIKTKRLRLWMQSATDGTTYAAQGVTEWETYNRTDGASLSLSASKLILSEKKGMQKASLIVKGENMPDADLSMSLKKGITGLTLSKSAITREKALTGDTVEVTFDPENATTAMDSLVISCDTLREHVPVMTSIDSKTFTEHKGNETYDPCLYTLSRLSTWGTAPVITDISEYPDVKCGATCVKFTGKSGIEMAGNLYLDAGDYTVSGWINTNGTFETGIYGNDGGFTSEQASSASSSSIAFDLPNTNGAWQYFEYTFNVTKSLIGGAWVNNDHNKTATLAYLDNWQIYPTHYADSVENDTYKDYPISPVAFTNVKFDDIFWSPRMKQNQEVTIPIALQQCYSTGRVDNFKKAAGLIEGYFNTDYPFDDTDIYKIIEGMSYSIQTNPSESLSAQMDTLVDLIGKAQEDDGYLYTARTAGEPGNLHPWVGAERWTEDPNMSHELYNCGHLYEAATAHYNATGKTTFLNIAIKNANLLVKDFLEGGLTYEPGHQIVEMGLVKMYRVTGNEDYLKLAKYFLDLRGNKGVGRKEYNQTHKPVIYQDEAVGHAVRAAYMYSGMADIAAMGNNETYLSAIDTLWNNVVGKKYYITGGIGALHDGEAFGANYELPNATAYNETCAAIANVYWNYRMFLLHGDAKYYDVIERTLYNGLISGIALDGKHFFYPNPLASSGGYTRSEWFGCACCPSNLCRFTASLPGYVYAHTNDSLYVNLFVQSNADIALQQDTVNIVQQSDYPWNGHVTLTVSPKASRAFSLMVRIPGWAQNRPIPSDLYTYLDASQNETTIKLNNETVNYAVNDKGYAVISRTWTKGDSVVIELPMDIHRTIANDNVTDDKGRVALERGPVVYCLEGCDNDGNVLRAVIPDTAQITATAYDATTLNGVVELQVKGMKANATEATTATLVAIPYYAWANRTDGQMEVWASRTPSFGAKPYAFNAPQWTGVSSRVNSVDCDTTANKVKVNGMSGSYNIALQFSKDFDDSLYVTSAQKYLTVRGEQMDSTASLSALWWLNGACHSVAIQPDYTYQSTDGEVIIVWDITKGGLNDNCKDATYLFSSNGASYNTVFGLTSTAADYSATISDVCFYSSNQLIEKYPVLATKMNLVTDGVTEATADSSSDDGSIYDLTGVRRGNTTKKKTLTKGVYVVNHKKMVIK